MKVLLMTFNAKYIHKALSLRWLYVSNTSNHDVDIKEYTTKDDIEQCAINIAALNYDVVGISTYIWNVECVTKFILKLNQINPNVRIILGGPEVSFDCEKYLDLPIECVLRGEGEQTFFKVVDGVKNVDGYYGKDYISDIVYAKSDLSYIETLESPYFLDFDLKDMKNRYFYFETSRGCPYRCAYCLSSVDNQVRFFSKEYIEKQLMQLKEYNVKQVKFLDRTFNADNEFAIYISKLMEKLQLNTTFQFEIVADHVSDNLMNYLLYEADVSKYRFEVGVQSFNQKTLKAVFRQQDSEKVKEVIKILSNRGYQLHADLIAGLPFEGYESFKDSFNQLFDTKPHEIQVGILKLLKGTYLSEIQDTFVTKKQLHSPFTVRATKWIKEDEMINVEMVYHATEKLLNSHKLFDSIQIFYELNLFDNPFDFLLECGIKLEKLTRPYQIADLFLLVSDVLKHHDQKLVMAILFNDYLKLFKQRPKKIFNDNITIEVKKNISEILIKEYLFVDDIIYNYTYITYGYFNKQICYQIIIYSKQQKIAQRIFMNCESFKIMEEN